MYVLNFIAMILCLIIVILAGAIGNIDYVIIGIIFILLNFPFAIKWLDECMYN